MATESKCPVMNGPQRHATAGARSNRDWWPNMLDLGILRQHSTLSDPMGEDFNYAEEFMTLDLAAVKRDINGTEEQRTKQFPPYRIMGNIYYVGAETQASFLVSTSQGLILINSNFEKSVPEINDDSRTQRRVQVFKSPPFLPR